MSKTPFIELKTSLISWSVALRWTYFKNRVTFGCPAVSFGGSGLLISGTFLMSASSHFYKDFWSPNSRSHCSHSFPIFCLSTQYLKAFWYTFLMTYTSLNDFAFTKKSVHFCSASPDSLQICNMSSLSCSKSQTR